MAGSKLIGNGFW